MTTGLFEPLIASASLSRLIALKQLIEPSSCSFKQVLRFSTFFWALLYNLLRSSMALVVLCYSSVEHNLFASHDGQKSSGRMRSTAPMCSAIAPALTIGYLLVFTCAYRTYSQSTVISGSSDLCGSSCVGGQNVEGDTRDQNAGAGRHRLHRS